MSRYTEHVLDAIAADAGQDLGATQNSTETETYAMPATQGQARFWALDRIHPGNPALNMPLMWRATGPLDIEALEHALTLCIARHESLRTTFSLLESKLVQVVHPPSPASLPVIDLEGHDPLEGERLTREHAALRMDLKAGPLLAVKLLRFDSTHHTLLVTMHHIICDGISNGILLRDMAAFYEERIGGKPAQLPELAIQFADFAVWEEEWLAGPEPAVSLEFWKHSLGDDFCPIELPRDLDALPSLTGEREHWTGDIETLLLPPSLQARALAFCTENNITLNILLFSIFIAMLRSITGQDDLLLGSPCANRTEQTEELIGLFMNIQVMRIRIAEGETFRELVAKVQEWTLGAYEHQHLPFEVLVNDAAMVSDRSFELPVFFLYQKSFMVTHRIGDLEIVPLRSESPGAVFEIMFAIVDRAEEGPRLQLEYNPRHFKVETIRRYLQTYVTLLENALASPSSSVSSLSVFTAAERFLVVSGWNGTSVDFGVYRPVTSLISDWVARAPGRVALRCGDVSLTYAELWGQARTVAARLRAEGLGAGDLVGLAIERSPAMLAALLGTLVAGCAYVPLDPRHPRERRELILEDSGCALLLTGATPFADAEQPFAGAPSRPGADAHPAQAGSAAATTVRTLAIADILSAPAPAADFADAVPAADALAYVIYTSGSTGVPKGVAIEHGALTNLLRAVERTPGLTAADTLVAITTLAFDIAALELLLPLVTGARLVVATDAEVQDGRLLLELLERAHTATPAGDTVLQATPGAWRILLDAGWGTGSRVSGASSALPLKALSGGEALPRELALRLLERAGSVWNMYGPTETTIWSSATEVTREALEAAPGTLRLGTPLANTQFHVLDRHRQLAPLGVAGELYIAGQGLARGYWNRPQLTAEKFVPNPFAQPGRQHAADTHPHARMYATGDLARRHPDGTVELLGRTDFQVKIRGYRIELTEIEAALRAHPAVQDAVLTHHTATTGATSLVAYIQAGTANDQDAETLIAELKANLAARLPDYMLPNAYLALPALPRNSNGKVDRKALPPLTAIGEGIHSTAAASEEFFWPQDVIERQVADIWQTTLGVPRISTRDSFFSLGVGSLAALRLITKLNRVYAMDLGLASLISASTIESIATLIRERFAPNTDSSVVPLQPHGDRVPLYIVHGVGGNIVSFYGLAMRMGKQQPVYGIQAQALVAHQPALLRLKDMAAHYIADVRAVQPHGPYRLLGYSFGGTVVLEMAHQLRAAGEEVEMLGMIDAKSRDYEEIMSRMDTVPARITHRVSRFRGNTGRLDWGARVRYVADKISTRAIRYACIAAARMHFTRVPAFMRSAYDINYVAVQNYRPSPYDGRLVLFRASEQDSRGPYDLGWGAIFTEGVEIHDMPGDHERIFLEPNIDLLAAGLQECLQR